MIKRHGVEMMNARTKNVSVSKETLAIIKDGHYTAGDSRVDISVASSAALRGTLLYTEYLPPPVIGIKIKPTIEVVNETTAQAAARLLSQGKTDIVALNFASGRNPGGGFLAGAIAQEEDLCRASGLYPCLKSKPVFYNENILCDSSFYTDNVIYSPQVPFFRDENLSLLEKPFTLSILSSPAPNVRGLQGQESDLLPYILSIRAFQVLKIAAKHGHKNIILGAWGCGAYGNDPNMVATAFAEALEEVPVFEHVCFAVYDTREPPVLLQAFQRVLKK